MADVSILQIGGTNYNLTDPAARESASQAAQTATTAEQKATEAKDLASQGFSVEFVAPDTIKFTALGGE